MELELAKDRGRLVAIDGLRGQGVEIQLDRFRSLIRDRSIDLAVEPEAVTFLAKRGYDPEYGARPLKRSIQRHLIDPLANELIGGQIKPGDKVVATLDSDGQRLSFRRADAQEQDAA